MMTGEQAHLGLADMTGLANGAPLPNAAGAHLASCPQCQAEAGSWRVVAAGVRMVMAGSEAPAMTMPEPVLTAIGSGGIAAGRPARWGRPGWRPAMAAAAAVLVLGGAGAGIATTLAAGRAGTPGSRPVAAALTSTSCRSLKLVAGTLVRVSGSSLVIRPPIGPAVRVSTSGSTTVAREVTGTLADVRDGLHVIVSGTRSHGQIEARRIGLTPSSLAMKPPLAPVQGAPAALLLGLANGTVAGAATGGFTVDEPGGAHVRVRTSAATTVVMLASVRVAQLKTGQRTVAVGSVTGPGELAARTVEQENLPLSQLRPARWYQLPLPAGTAPLRPRGFSAHLPSAFSSGSAFPLRGAVPLRGGAPRAAGLPSLVPSPGRLYSGLGCNASAIAATGLLAFGS